MRHLTAILCLTLAVLLGSAGVGWSADQRYCKTPVIDSPLGGNWDVKKVHYFKNPDLGFSIEFDRIAATANLYIYDLGISKIELKDLDQQLRQSISEAFYSFGKHSPDASLSEPMLVPKISFSHLDNLIDNAVYVVVSNGPITGLTIISMGFDGRCFQKIRFTAKIPSTDKKDVVGGLMVFFKFVNALYIRLFDVGYYK